MVDSSNRLQSTAVGCRQRAVGRWQPAVGSGQRAVGCWMLAVGCWMSAAGSGQLDVGCWLSAVGRWQRAAGSWMLAVGCWTLDVGRWQRAAGCWLLDVGSGASGRRQTALAEKKGQIRRLANRGGVAMARVSPADCQGVRVHPDEYGYRIPLGRQSASPCRVAAVRSFKLVNRPILKPPIMPTREE